MEASETKFFGLSLFLNFGIGNGLGTHNFRVKLRVILRESAS